VGRGRLTLMIKTYDFEAKIWLYSGEAAWHFITLPVDIAHNIDFYFDQDKKGWGSLPVQVTVGNTTWTTSIFPDKQSGSYMLPLKAEVRKKEQLKVQDTVQFSLSVGS
jgi:hypothetical protein